MNKQIVMAVVVFGCIQLARVGNAAVPYDWNFKIASQSTSLSEIVSTGTALPVSFSNSPLGVSLKVSNGGLQVQQQDGTVSNPANNSFADIDNLSAGKHWLVAEISGWKMNAGTVDFAFTVADRPNAATASLRMTKSGSKISVRLIHKDGFEQTVALDSSDTAPVVLVLEIDNDRSKTRICSKYADENWVCSAEQNTKMLGDVTHARTSASAMQVGDAIGLDRLYVTDVDPLFSPSGM